MNMDKKRVVLISASPKITEESMSDRLSSLGEKNIADKGIDISRIQVRKSLKKGQQEFDFETMIYADALVFVFPLYIFCLPGMLMRFLQDFYQYYNSVKKERVGNVKVFAVVNCGFPEPNINQEAVRVIQSFSSKIGGLFRFGVLIGGGPMIHEAKEAPFLKKTRKEIDIAFEKIKKDILDSDLQAQQNISIKVRFPRKLYFFMGSRGWIYSARKNRLKKRDLYLRPYRE